MGQAVLALEDGQALIKVTQLWKHYRKRPATLGVDLTVSRGEVFGLVGPDGAGKSTLMKAIAGVLRFDSGGLEVLGVRIDSDRAAERVKDRIGFMPQGLGLNLYPDLSVEENIDFFARLRSVGKQDLKDSKERLLAVTRLERFRDRPMKQLSGGMKQKLGLICTLIHAPELIILDEPTTGVDPVSRRDFWTILSQLRQESEITVLASTAYMDEASRFDRISLMYDGRILAQGEPGQLWNIVPGTEVQVRAEPHVEALKLLKSAFTQVESLGDRLHVFVKDPNAEAAVDLVQKALLTVEIHEIAAEKPDLEDIFIALMGSQDLIDRHSGQPGPEHPPSITPGAAPNGLAIEALELTRDFGKFRAVDGVSFQVKQGEIFGLLGANGAGKTTVIKMLIGILTPSSGKGHVAGADMRFAGQAIKRRIGYVSQAFSLYQDLKVIENLNLFAGIYGLSRADSKERTGWAIETGGLSGHENERTGRLPMGLRQRLALGCALLHRPRVLFLDEPTSGVDPAGRRQLWNNLFDLSKSEGVAILVTTHYMSEAEHCDRLALMHAGKFVAEGSAEDMKHSLESEVGRLIEIETDRPVQAVECLSQNGFTEAALFGKRIHILSSQIGPDTERISELLSAGDIRVISIAPRALSMEDVFVYRVRKMERQEKG